MRSLLVIALRFFLLGWEVEKLGYYDSIAAAHK